MGCISLEKLKIFKVQYEDFYSLTNISSQHKLLKSLIYNTHNFTHESQNGNSREIDIHNLFFKNAKKVDYKTIEDGKINCFWKDYNNKIKNKNSSPTQTIKISNSDLDFKIKTSSDYRIEFNPGLQKINQEIDIKLPGILIFLTSNHPDLSWQTQNNPDPYVPPQTHSVKSKSKINYYVDNGNYALKSLSHVISNPVMLLQSGLFMEIDDPDALFLSSKDLNFQVYSNNWENLFILPEVEISYDREKRDINMIRKSSEILFKIKLDLLVIDKNLFTNNEQGNLGDSENSIFTKYTQINQFIKIDKSKINFSGSAGDNQIEYENQNLKKIKQRLLLNELTGDFTTVNSTSIIDNYCNLFILDENSIISSNEFLSKSNFYGFYITCDISSPNHKINMSFIRNHLASSLINLEIPNHKNILNTNIIGAFSINDQDSYMNGSVMNSERVYCMSSFEKQIVDKLLLNNIKDKDRDKDEKNTLENEDDEFVINPSAINIYITLKKIKLLIWEISFSQDFYHFNKRLENVSDITISFSNELKISFSPEEIKNKSKKILKFPADMVNLIGTSLNIKISRDSNRNSLESSVNFSDYQCTLFKANYMEKESIDKFYDLTAQFEFEDQNGNHNSLSSSSNSIKKTFYIFLIIVISMISLYLVYYMFKRFRICRIKNSIFSSGALNYQNITRVNTPSGRMREEGVGVDLSSKNDYPLDI